MKIALVHDSISEFGGAERVLEALLEIWPRAPIYTAFYKKGPAWDRFKDKEVHVSWANSIPFFATKLHSPFRFLAPLIWNSFNLSKYDIVISSSSWYITKGFGGRRDGPVEICYCHTPPRWLYGYETPVKKNWLVKSYILVVAHFVRMYDWKAAQKVNYFVANSENVKKRIQKFYKREAVVIYPPVEVGWGNKGSGGKKGDYYLVVSRITGGKGIEMAVKAANKLKVPLKIVGVASGYSDTCEWVKKNAGLTVEMLGYVKDPELARLYVGAKAFLALSPDEDFGITPVEAMSYGTPVIAYRSGGYLETVVEGKTGIFFDEYTVEGLIRGIREVGKIRVREEDCRVQARKFSKERFKKGMKEFVEKTFKERK
ncbi:MAG: glycosyltransferase [Candidatus Blackburnbacteria bacterium]|nr:glycosyltransferase [Candidatus Blackburnbacteria bacterium]